MRVILKREASAEVAAAARWYEAQTEGVGVALIGEVEAALRTIAESPELRRFVLSRFPYAGRRRRPNYWFGRAR